MLVLSEVSVKIFVNERKKFVFSLVFRIGGNSVDNLFGSKCGSQGFCFLD